MEKEFEDFSPKMDYLTIALVYRLYIVGFYCVKAKIMKMYFKFSKEGKKEKQCLPPDHQKEEKKNRRE